MYNCHDKSIHIQKLIKLYKLSEEWEVFCENYRKVELDEIHNFVEERENRLNAKLKNLCRKYGI